MIDEEILWQYPSGGFGFRIVFRQDFDRDWIRIFESRDKSVAVVRTILVAMTCKLSPSNVSMPSSMCGPDVSSDIASDISSDLASDISSDVSFDIFTAMVDLEGQCGASNYCVDQD